VATVLEYLKTLEGLTVVAVPLESMAIVLSDVVKHFLRYGGGNSLGREGWKGQVYGWEFTHLMKPFRFKV